MKKKNLRMAVVLTASTIAVGALAGCGSSSEVPTGSEAVVTEENVTAEASMAQSEEVTSTEEAKDNADTKAEEPATEASSAETSSNNLFTKVDSGVLSGKDALKGNDSELPVYEYPGAELFYTVVYDYIRDEFGSQYLPGDVTIPCPVIIAEDDSDRSDMLLYGAFYVYNYDLTDDTLMTISGGSHPGLMHIKCTDEGYEVTGFDAVLDGSDYEPSAKKIFGDHYDAFQKAIADSEATEEIRAQIISNYAAANNLNITGFQDYGWEKKALPTENIDSFYSTY